MAVRASGSFASNEYQQLRRLNTREPSLWSSDPATMAAIAERLGWLDLPSSMKSELPCLTEFRQEVVEEGFTRVVLLGMGGSSLCPLVLSKMFDRAPGYPELLVLDSTNPDEVMRVTNLVDPRHTMFIVASKSGTTVEPLCHYSFFRDRLAHSVNYPGSHFVAITDPGTPLEELAKAHSFRRVFLNPADMGGRYSALSLFGLLPAALLGLDVEGLLESGARSASACSSDDPARNPGWLLGRFLAAMWYQNRDKLTLLLPRQIAPFGLWVEQLVAESLGKHGIGIVPIVSEQPLPVERYGPDRYLISCEIAGADGQSERLPELLPELLESGELPYQIVAWQGLKDIGYQFFLWEYATAAAGALLGLNPFDEPDVVAAKRNTIKILAAGREVGAISPDPAARTERLTLTLSSSAKINLSGKTGPADVIRSFITSARLGRDYLAVLAFLPYDKNLGGSLDDLVGRLRATTPVPVTVGFGPRYLHSTGQLHKGGANNVLVMMILSRADTDADIPAIKLGGDETSGVSFAALHQAQALGDFQALDYAGRRVLMVNLSDYDALKELTGLL